MKVQRIAGLEARLICGTDKFGGRARLPWQDLLVTAAQRDEVVRTLQAADIVHIHNRWTCQRIFRLWPETLTIVRGKPKVLQFHSPRESLLKDTPDSFTLKCPKMVVAQYQWRFYQDATPVPNVVPIDDAWHTPHALWSPYAGPDTPNMADADMPLRVAFCPSNLGDRGWDNKGYKVTRDLLRRMPEIEHQIFTGMELPDLLMERKKYHVCIDEVMTGSYHLVSLEALAQGQVAIANLDSKTVDALERITGTRRHPWMLANLKELPALLKQLNSDRKLLHLCGSASRRYMEKYWDPFRVTRLYEEVYNRA
jgi:hypothetical protein